MPCKVEDVDDAVPDRPPLKALGYRHRLHELGRAAMHPLDRISQLVRVDFLIHSPGLRASAASRNYPGSISNGPHSEWLAEILRERQWMRSPLGTRGQSGAVRLIEVSAGRATRLLHVP